MDESCEAILKRLSELDREIALTLEDAQEFLRLIQSYLVKLDHIQERLLELKQAIHNGTFNTAITTEIELQIQSFEALSDPEVKRKLRNRFDVITNFENYAVKETDKIVLKYFLDRVDEFKPLLN